MSLSIGVPANSMASNPSSTPGTPRSKYSGQASPISKVYEFEFLFERLPLGLILKTKSAVTIVSGFVNVAASRDGKIRIGDEVIRINDIIIEGLKPSLIHSVVSKALCPITITFRRRAKGSEIDLLSLSRSDSWTGEGRPEDGINTLIANSHNISSLMDNLHETITNAQKQFGLQAEAVNNIMAEVNMDTLVKSYSEMTTRLSAIVEKVRTLESVDVQLD